MLLGADVPPLLESVSEGEQEMTTCSTSVGREEIDGFCVLLTQFLVFRNQKRHTLPVLGLE